MPSYKDSKTGKWYCQFYYRDELTGKNKHKVKRGFDKKKDADAWERNFKQQEKTSDILMDDLLNQYEAHLYTLETLNIIRKSTVLNRLEAIKFYIRPYFAGDILAKNITTKNINDWIVKLKTRKNKFNQHTLSSSTVNSKRTVLKQVFEYGITNCGLIHNPVDKSEKAKFSSCDNRAKFWTAEQYNIFYDALDDEQYRIIFNLLFYTGMRIGEALALTPADISPYTISVKSTLRKMTYKGSRITNIGPPKNKSSERIIDIPHFLYNQIMNYINSLYGLDPNQTIITLAYTTIHNKMCSTIEKTGLPHISPHILRHSYATTLGSLSDVVVVSGQLGHSSPKTTMQTYTHLLPGKASQAVEKFEKLIINSKNFSAEHIINSN